MAGLSVCCVRQEELMKVLRAYAVYNPADGYSQAQAPLAAVLLMHMPTEQAFWCLVSICKEYLPGYYGPGIERVQLDGDILHGLVKRVAPHVYRHLVSGAEEPAAAAERPQPFSRRIIFGTRFGTKSGTKSGTNRVPNFVPDFFFKELSQKLSLQNNALKTHDNGK